MSTLNVNRVVDSSGGVLAPISSVMRNRIINGQMVIDQRNAGASVTATAVALQTYASLDRYAYIVSQASKFSLQQNAGSVTPPTGFTNYLGVTSLAATSVGASDYFLLYQNIEGFNASDLGWGTANAKTITLSFWVRSSLTGTFGGAIRNGSFNRTYPFTYTISAANTWEQKSITIVGDTTGTWATTNTTGISLGFSLGIGSTFSGTAGSWQAANFSSATGATSVVGTSGATWYLTGVQIEVGTQATSFEYRQYGQELALCQRYFCKNSDINVVPTNGMLFSTTGAFMPTAASAYNAAAIWLPWIPFPVTMRATPTTVTFINTGLPLGGATSGQWSIFAIGGGWANFPVTTINNSSTGLGLGASSGTYTTNQGYVFYGAWNASAEL